VKFCYLIMTHQNGAQIARLVRTVIASSRDGWVLLLHDRKGVSLQDVPDLDDPRVVVLTAPFDIHRGEFSQVEAYLYALGWLQRCARPWHWLVYLSGQDYPVRPVWETEQMLADSPCDAFLHYWEVGGANDVWRPRQGQIRYAYQYRRLPDWTAPLLRALKWTHGMQDRWRVFQTYGAYIGTRAKTLPFGPRFKLYGGYTWHYLRRECADYVLEFQHARPDILAHYRRCMAPDESFLPTVLANAGLFRLCNDNRRYVDWRNSTAGRPRVLTIDDLPSMCTDAYDFARKFDTRVDSRVLDQLDRRIAARNVAAGAR
jgi:hypothetical protein